MTKKNVLIYIGGVVSGIILTFVVLFAISMSQATGSNTQDNIVMFDEPQDVIHAKKFEVMQVLPDGTALATVKYDMDDANNDNMGMVVLFIPKEGTSFFDDQIIKVPEGKCARQVGTYRYITRQEMEKTVPVVEILNK